MLIKDIMTSNPAVVLPTDSVGEAARLMKLHGVGLLPIVENKLYKRLLGVITDRDIVVRCVADQRSTDDAVAEFMTPTPIASTDPLADVSAAVEVMRESDLRRLPVLDEDEIVLGVISRVDVERAFNLSRDEPDESGLVRISHKHVVS